MDNKIMQLLSKYDVPTPRYTSYPTVPYWDFSTINAHLWKQSVLETYKKEDNGLSLYIHLPFCENLCTFCACNKRITKNHGVESSYINAVLKEWDMYRVLLPGTPVIREIHLGGGTPTFFSAGNLSKLINGIATGAVVHDDHEFSVEVHPNYSTEEHIATLASLGFNRISLGVQDFDPAVQFAINRIQSFKKTKEVVDWARKYDYQSINIDLVYGLPHQTIASVEHSIQLIKSLSPNRIAFYSYAHVPWKSRGQRRYTEQDLPAPVEKWKMYNRGKTLLELAGFESIGMDHFALKTDSLFKAAESGGLHRNFMGYTTTNCKLIVGLGASSISDSWLAFAQNEKVVEIYEDRINQGVLPLAAGHLLSDEDLIIRQNILDLMCNGETNFSTETSGTPYKTIMFDKLKELEGDGLISVDGENIKVSKKGRLFIRNIAAAIDVKLWAHQLCEKTFSKAI